MRLRNPMHCSPPGSSVRGISQARILEWVATPSSRGPSQPRDQTRASGLPALAGGFFTTSITLGLPGGSAGKESACNARDPGSIPGSGRSPGEGIGYLFQYSDLEKNSMDCIVHGVTKSWTQLRLSLTQTLESPLDSKEIKSVNPEGNQP